jgi:probable blue pigment (indigoidine) exporter
MRSGGERPSASARTFGRSTVVLLGVLAAVWGSTFPVVREGVVGGASPFLFVAVALLLAGGVTALVALVRRPKSVSPREIASSLAVGALLIGGTNLFLAWGERFATGGLAAIVFALAPLLAYVGVRWLGGERAGHRWAPVALLVGLAGVCVIAYGSLGSAMLTDPWGVAALLAGVTCQATGAVLIGRWRPHGESPVGQAAQFAGGGLAALVTVAAFGGSLALPETGAVLTSIAFFALATCVVGYAVYFELLRRVGAVGANLVTFLNPIVAVAVGGVWLGEPFSGPEVVGLFLVLLALVLFGRGSPETPGDPAKGAHADDRTPAAEPLLGASQPIHTPGR